MRLPVLTAALLIAVTLLAQDTAFPVPPYDEVFYRYDRAAGKLVELERQVAAVESKPKALGLAGYKASFYLRGAHSSIRFRQGDALEFVFSLPQRSDPHAVQFYALRKAGNRRELIQMQSNRPSTFGVGTARDVSDKSSVPYDVQKGSASAYRLTPSTPLDPGEYVLSMATNNVGYAFGVDSAISPAKPGK